MSDINFVLMATAWGPRHGGINAFNRDFSVGLAAALGSRGRVFCAVLDPKDSDHADAKSGSVTLIPIVGKKASDQFDTAWTYEIVNWLKRHASAPAISWWVGHDVTSGAAALAGSDAGLGGRPALIHHMSYIAYQGVKRDNGPAAVAKNEEQRKLFASNEAVLFGVGPLLRDSCRRLAGGGREPVMLVPGFPAIGSSKKEESKLVAVSFGRMEAASDRIKQGQLSVAAFGAAIKAAKDSPYCPPMLDDPELYVIGLPTGEAEEANAIRDLAEAHAGRIVNILPLPFDEDREKLLGRLAEANLAFMLSWHEGFGLTGWESIAAEVPLIISKRSGLFQLLKETLNGVEESYVAAIDLQGRRGDENSPNFTENDLSLVEKQVLNMVHDNVRAQARARELKELLQQKLICSWVNTGHQFLQGLGIDCPPGGPQPIPPGPDRPLPNTDEKPPEQTKLDISGISEERRSLSRDERFDRLKQAIRKDLARSEHVVEKLEKAFGLAYTRGPDIAERAGKLCDKLLEVNFVKAVHALKDVRLRLDNDEKAAINCIANVSGWLFPWLYVREAGIDCEQWERKELGQVISLPTDIISFAEIIMAGIDVRMAEFKTIKDPRDWPRSVMSLNFWVPEEGLLDDGTARSVDENNIRMALASVLNIPAEKRRKGPEIIDRSINMELEHLFRKGSRWYFICAQFHNDDDRRRHGELMATIARSYKSLAIVDLGLDDTDHHEIFRNIQELLNLHGGAS